MCFPHHGDIRGRFFKFSDATKFETNTLDDIIKIENIEFEQAYILKG